MPSITVPSLPPDVRHTITVAAVQMLCSLGCNVGFRTAEQNGEKGPRLSPADLTPVNEPLPGGTFQCKTAGLQDSNRILKIGLKRINSSLFA